MAVDQVERPAAASGGDDGADDRFRGALVGTVVGDALGAPVEGHPGPVAEARLVYLEEHGRRFRYTDDSAMTFALAESLLFCGDLDEDHLAATFAAHYERDPARGYGPGTASLLARVAAGADWRKAADRQFGGQGSLGNGAAMRVAPIALYSHGDLHRTVALARRSARVTHAHPEGVDGAAVQAAAVALALAQPGDLHLDGGAFLAAVRQVAATEALARNLDVVAGVAPGSSAGDVAAVMGTGITAAEAVPAAICAFLSHPDSFAGTVSFAIGLGGDTDTIAAMAAAISGARLGASSVPPSWMEQVEGTKKAITLADRLRWRLYRS